MPYNVQVSNRFALDIDNTSSEDEGIQNEDPYAVIQKAEADAKKKAQAMIKNQAELAKQQAKEAKLAEQKKKEENKKEEEKAAAKKDTRGNRGRGGRGRGEPRGNFQRRSGKRNEDAPTGDAVEAQGGDRAVENGWVVKVSAFTSSSNLYLISYLCKPPSPITPAEPTADPAKTTANPATPKPASKLKKNVTALAKAIGAKKTKSKRKSPFKKKLPLRKKSTTKVKRLKLRKSLKNLNLLSLV